MNLVDVFLQRARQQPHAVAIVDGDQDVRYLDLERGVLATAAALAAHGIGPGTVVGLASRHVTVHLVVTLAVARLGAATMPLGLGTTVAEQLEPLRRLGVQFLIGERSLRGDEGFDGFRYIAADASLLGDQLPPAAGGTGADVGIEPWRLTMSSGTTGTQKVIALTHDRVLTQYFTQQCVLPYGPGTRLFMLIGLNVSFGLNHCLRQLIFGGTVVAYSDQLKYTFDVCERHRVTHLIASPAVAAQLLEMLPDDRPRLPDVQVFLGGGPVSPALRDGVLRRLSPQLGVLYGASELGLVAMGDAPTFAEHPDCAGRVAPWIVAQAVDGDGRPLPAGRTGELRFRSLDGFPGYHGDPQATDRVLRDGWFHPGDIGRVTRDGLLFVVGRVDEVLNIGGVKVLPATIEAVLEEHPDVAEVAAFAAEAPDGQQVLVAVVVSRGAFDEQALLAHCRARLGRQSPVRIARVKSLPRTESGKVLRRVLASRVRFGAAPGPAAQAASAGGDGTDG